MYIPNIKYQIKQSGYVNVDQQKVSIINQPSNQPTKSHPKIIHNSPNPQNNPISQLPLHHIRPLALPNRRRRLHLVLRIPLHAHEDRNLQNVLVRLKGWLVLRGGKGPRHDLQDNRRPIPTLIPDFAGLGDFLGGT